MAQNMHTDRLPHERSGCKNLDCGGHSSGCTDSHAYITIGVIEAYIRETFPAQMQALIRTQPASSWVDPERLVQFAADYYQRGSAVSAALTTSTPPLRVSTSPGHSAKLPGPGLRATSGSPVVAGANPRASAQASAQRSVRVVDMTPFPDFPRQGGASLLKNIEEVYVLTEIPKCWPVPRVNTAYLLDLSQFPKEPADTYASDGIVKNKHNTFQNTLRGNLKRKVRHTERAIAEQQLQKTIGDIDEQIDFHLSQKRKLQDEKENLTSTSAGKKTRFGGASNLSP
ncbi:hypothetical protein AURDEDRAFT_178046 [Auricularia subglabra TFB-10046 SS5]|uniref:Uncharacterized protein n=1 Tax=Auricularia subglabra (strain TFB-10046 / SS5) TaxID=717982 RepID=J0WM35_AURST|nr:hypothetical protein AURDEDRAFT_178046 [Auricularia subglabra TFB-10046 SS5]